jgi:MSHA biogenesis protein MshJ
MKEQLADIRARIAPALAKIDGLSRRERLLVTVTMFATIAIAWHVLFMGPLEHRADASRAELESLKLRIETANRNLEEQILQLAGAGNEDRWRIAEIRRRIDAINSELGNYAAELIDPAEMAHVLEEILKEQTSLSLVRIRNKSPELITGDDENAATSFYRHVLEIEVEGTYAACLDYLNAVEDLPWRLYWQLLDLEVIEYPQNRIRIEVSTLSLDEEWIGAS